MYIQREMCMSYENRKTDQHLILFPLSKLPNDVKKKAICKKI